MMLLLLIRQVYVGCSEWLSVSFLSILWWFVSSLNLTLSLPLFSRRPPPPYEKRVDFLRACAMDWVKSNNNDLFLDSCCDVLLMVGKSISPHSFLYLVYDQVI